MGRNWCGVGNRGRGRALRVAGGAVTAVLVGLLTAVPAQAGPAARSGLDRAAAAATGQSGVAALDVVVLVDESGSETPQKVADEKQTVGTIVQTMLNPSSRVTVIGFGGVNHVVPNQNPVDVVCQPTIASGAGNLDYLSSCVGGLHRRTEPEGDDTDYADALIEAMHYLGPGSAATPAAPSGAIKVVLMMTDGAVDVHRNTQQYGVNWQLGEQTAINQQLAAAISADVQLWPLGFGTDIGTGLTQPQALQYLNTMAAHGASAVCDTRHVANQPHATWVNNPDDAIDALDQLYADAACLGTSTVQGPARNNLSVSIPAIASAAAISVDRVNPAVGVTFVQPDGVPWTNAAAISGADSDSPDEVLHLDDITRADVGTWTVKLSASAALADQLVSATVFWQGAVRAIITATPSVSPGQPIAVKLTVLGPTGPITDPATLKSLLVGVTASGPGRPSPVKVDVRAVGGPTGVGSYAGSYPAPSQPTTLTITGTAAGYGLYATQIPATVSVGLASRGFMATPHFSGAASVQAGGSISGSVDFTNTTGSTRNVRLKLTVGGAIASISPDTTITVPSATSGSPPSVPFTVTFAQSSPAGPAGLEVQAIDADTGQLYNAASDEITVTTPPTFFDRYKWDGLGLLALIILLIMAALGRRRVVRDRKNVRGLVAILRFGGEQAGRELAADEKYSEVFPFTIATETTPPYLNHPARGATAGLYQVRRGGRGLVRLMPPAGGLRPYEIEVGGPGQALGDGLEVAFRDTRHPSWTGSAATAAAGYERTEARPTRSSATTPEDWSGGGAPAHEGWSGSGPAAADWSGGGATAATTWPPSPPPEESELAAPPTMPGTGPAPHEDPWL